MYYLKKFPENDIIICVWPNYIIYNENYNSKEAFTKECVCETWLKSIQYILWKFVHKKMPTKIFLAPAKNATNIQPMCES